MQQFLWRISRSTSSWWSFLIDQSISTFGFWFPFGCFIPVLFFMFSSLFCAQIRTNLVSFWWCCQSLFCAQIHTNLISFWWCYQMCLLPCFFVNVRYQPFFLSNIVRTLSLHFHYVLLLLFGHCPPLGMLQVL